MYTDFCLTVLDDADQGDNGKQDDAPQGLLIHFVSKQWADSAAAAAAQPCECRRRK